MLIGELRAAFCQLIVYGFVQLTFTTSAGATPLPALPINSQLPPVAVLDEVFDFVFSNSTFTTSDAVEYSIANAPPWLKLDNDQRRLWGTPSSDSLGSSTFSLIATDSSSSASMLVTLVVSSTSGPTASKDALQQLTRGEDNQQSNIITSCPGSEVKIQFRQDAFTNVDKNTEYYALGTDRTPLPSWLQFDANSLAFSGMAPVSISPTELPQMFDLTLFASDVPGYSQSNISFHLLVDSHRLQINPSSFEIDIQAGIQVDYKGLQNTIDLDGKLIYPSDLNLNVSDCPSWISIDHDTLVVTGEAPPEVQNSTFTIAFTDNVGDSAVASVFLHVSTNLNNTYLILGQIGPVTAEIGVPLSFTIQEKSFSSKNVSASIDLGNASSWLTFNDANLTLMGTPPKDLQPQQEYLVLTAVLGDHLQTQNISLVLIEASHESGTALGTPSASPTALMQVSSSAQSPTTTLLQQQPLSGKRIDTRKIVPAIVLPILLVSGIMVLIFSRRISRFLNGKSKPEADHSGSNTMENIRDFSTLLGSRRQILPRIERHSAIISGPETEERNLTTTSEVVMGRYPIKSSISGHRQRPPRPKPPSDAPQVGRFILERDPDPFRELMESEHFRRSSQDAPSAVKLRSASEPLCGYGACKPGVVDSSLQTTMARVHKPPVPIRSRSFTGTCTEDGNTLKQIDETLDFMDSFSPSFSLPSLPNESFLRPRLRTEGAIDLCSGLPLSSPQHPHTTSWVTVTSHRTSEVSELPDRQDSPSLHGPLKPLGSNASQTADMLHSWTVRPVSPSESSRTSSFPKHRCKDPRDQFSNRRSLATGLALDSTAQNPRSLMRDNSDGIASSRMLQIQRRRQKLKPISSSSSNIERPALHDSDASTEMSQDKTQDHDGLKINKSSGEIPKKSILVGTNQLVGANTATPNRTQAMDLASIIQTNLNLSRSSVATSELSMGKIERQFEETQEKARYNRRHGNQRRSSLNRLSALLESHGSNDGGCSVKIRDSKAVGLQAQENLSHSVSFKGDISEWKTDDERSGGSSRESPLFI